MKYIETQPSETISFSSNESKKKFAHSMINTEENPVKYELTGFGEVAKDLLLLDVVNSSGSVYNCGEIENSYKHKRDNEEAQTVIENESISDYYKYILSKDDAGTSYTVNESKVFSNCSIKLEKDIINFVKSISLSLTAVDKNNELVTKEYVTKSNFESKKITDSENIIWLVESEESIETEKICVEFQFDSSTNKIEKYVKLFVNSSSSGTPSKGDDFLYDARGKDNPTNVKYTDIKSLIVTIDMHPCKVIAVVDFGKDGRNNKKEQINASITKTPSYKNETIIVTYDFDEIVKQSIGSLDPVSGEILLSDEVKSWIIDGSEFVDTEYDKVKCSSVNTSLNVIGEVVDDVIIGDVQEWLTEAGKVSELYPVVNDGSLLDGTRVENIVPGSVVLYIDNASGEEAKIKYTDKGVRSVRGILEGTTLSKVYNIEDESVNTEGVLHKYELQKINSDYYWVRTKSSVGHVYYNTGVIELKEAVDYVEQTKPALYCKYEGLTNLKLNIKDKGTDGDNYKLTITEYDTLGDGNVIYNLNLYREDSLVETIQVSTDENGSTYEKELEDGTTVDITVPYILDLEDDYYDVSYNGEVEDLRHLYCSRYSFVNGSDGVEGIKPEDYIGYKLESGEAAGAWCFDNPKYSAQMWPSLGYSDKEFYQAMKEIAWRRKDTTCVLDVPKTYGKTRAIQWRESEKEFKDEPVLDCWWQELYYNWCEDVYNNTVVELPPSYYVTRNSLLSYSKVGTWYPVAGKSRGVLDCSAVLMQVPSKTDRDDLITHNINPIFDTGNNGIQIYGNETLNGEYSDLSAAHIGRTLTYIRSQVDAYTETLKFELNDVMLWRTWIDYVDSKILNPIKGNRGLQWYRVSMGRDTTTAEEIANRVIRGVVELQFTPDAEIFKLDYVVYSSSVDNTTL